VGSWRHSRCESCSPAYMRPLNSLTSFCWLKCPDTGARGSMAFADHRHCSSSTSGSRRVSELSERGEGRAPGTRVPGLLQQSSPAAAMSTSLWFIHSTKHVGAISWSAAQCDKSVLLPVLGGGSDDERLLSVASLIPQGERISGLSF
jgi:hypothetical protein